MACPLQNASVLGLVPGSRLFSTGLTWALNNSNDVQRAFLTKLDANALRRARPEFFQLAHQATRSGIGNRLGWFNRYEKSVLDGEWLVTAHHDVNEMRARRN